MKAESGSAHALIVGVLTVSLILAIGVIFWQNVINKNPSTNDALAQTSRVDEKEDPDSKYCTAVEKLCFDYPADWKVDAKQSEDILNDGMAETIAIKDSANKKWLQLQTGMSGLGGACGSEEGSYTRVLETHTTALKGAYLSSTNTEAAKYTGDQAYAVKSISYNSTAKLYMASLKLYVTKAAANVGSMDACALGLGIFPGKNVTIKYVDDTTDHGAIAFGSSNGDAINEDYATEKEAVAALQTADANKAMSILKSVRYEN